MTENDNHPADRFKDLARDLGADEGETCWDDRRRKVAKGKPQPWRVDFVKRGAGHVARRVGASGISEESPAFDTPQAVYAWLAESGFVQDERDPDIWR